MSAKRVQIPRGHAWGMGRATQTHSVHSVEVESFDFALATATALGITNLWGLGPVYVTTPEGEVMGIPPREVRNPDLIIEVDVE